MNISKLEKILSSSRQIKHNKNLIKYIEQKTKDEEHNPKTKTMLESDQKTACSIKCLAVKKTSEVKPATRFFNEKMLMFAKISLISFINGLLETFCFPNEKTKAIYETYMIEIIIPFHVLTNIDSTCMLFIFFCKPESTFPDSTYRDCLFEVILPNEIYHHFDTWHKFWDRFSARNASLEKYLGCYRIEHIADPCHVRVVVNMKNTLKNLIAKI